VTLVSPTGSTTADVIANGTTPSSFHAYTATINGSNSCPNPIPLWVKLVSEQNGIHGGGILSWSEVSFPVHGRTLPVTFHLYCGNGSVVGADQLSNPACLGCQCSSPPGSGAALNCAMFIGGPPCSCLAPFDVGSLSGTSFPLNNPDSQLGGTDVLGHPLAAPVHVEVSLGPNLPFVTRSTTMSINCQ
jgi:hypothetical protein